jgi:hypothetical protein
MSSNFFANFVHILNRMSKQNLIKESARDDSAWFFNTLKSLLLDSAKIERDFPFLRKLFPRKVFVPDEFYNIEVMNADNLMFLVSFFGILSLVAFVIFTSYASYGTIPIMGSSLKGYAAYRTT